MSRFFFIFLLVFCIRAPPFDTVERLMKYFPWKQFNKKLPDVCAILIGWPYDVPYPDPAAIVNGKDKGINDLKEDEAKSLITSLREERFFARPATEEEGNGM